MDSMHPSYGPPNRDDDNLFLVLGAVPMRDRVDGVRRAVLRRSPGLGPHTKIPRLESLQAQLGSSPAHSSGLRYWYQLAKSTRSSTMAALARREQLAALARSEHERAARRLPAAALFAVCA